MLSFLGRKGGEREPKVPAEAAPVELHAEGATAFAFAAHLRHVDGLAIPDWDAGYAWIDTIADESAKARAWAMAELAWLLHLRDALGPRYHVAAWLERDPEGYAPRPAEWQASADTTPARSLNPSFNNGSSWHKRSTSL